MVEHRVKNSLVGEERLRRPSAPGYPAGMLVLLLACTPAPKPISDPADSATPDSGIDTEPDDTAADTSPDDTALGDTAPDTAAPDPVNTGPKVWTGTFFEAPDVRITSCGSSEDELFVAEGPDLDGDGLPEVAIGSPDADGDVYGQGRVYVLSGADVATGTADMFAPLASVTVPGAQARDGFGAELAWIADRDGDGLDDLLVAGGGYWFVSGADLLAGGDLAPTSVTFFGVWGFPERWDDVDGDGRDDWILADSGREEDWTSGGGAVYVLLDADFGPTGATAPLTWVGGAEEYRYLGGDATPLDVDLDGDGLRELLVTDAADAVVLGSSTILAGETSALVAEIARIPGVGAGSLVVLGDTDGGGVEEVAFVSSSDDVCVIRGEDLTGGTIAPSCAVTANMLAAAGDVDSDGDLDV